MRRIRFTELFRERTGSNRARCLVALPNETCALRHTRSTLHRVAHPAGGRQRIATMMNRPLFRRPFGRAGSTRTVAFATGVYAFIRFRTPMRRIIAFAILALGALAGLLSAAEDNWGTRIVMIGVGLLFTGPVAGVVGAAGRRRRRRREMDWSFEPMTSDGTSTRDLAANYWRDQGHAPFTKPPSGPPDKHQFDPNRIV